MKQPNFYYENKLINRGFKFIAGADEVGRGSFAGPVVAGVCVFGESAYRKMLAENVIINDSKKLTDRRRRLSKKWIKENCLAWGIGKSSVAEINKYGISKATSSAFRRAIGSAQLRSKKCIDYLLVDAFFVPYTRGLPVGKKRTKNQKKNRKTGKKVKNGQRQIAIVNGDEKSVSIAAASIIAKVYRDDLMIRLSKNKRYKKYGWDRNKGYGTLHHREMIKSCGISHHHRKVYCQSLFFTNKPS